MKSDVKRMFEEWYIIYMSFWKIGEVQKNPKKGACNMLEGKLSLVMVMHLPKFQVHFDCTVNLSHEVCLGIDENISCNCSMFLCLYPSHFNLFLFISYHKITIYFQMFNVSEQFLCFLCSWCLKMTLSSQISWFHRRHQWCSNCSVLLIIGSWMYQ